MGKKWVLYWNILDIYNWRTHVFVLKNGYQFVEYNSAFSFLHVVFVLKNSYQFVEINSAFCFLHVVFVLKNGYQTWNSHFGIILLQNIDAFLFDFHLVERI